VKPELLEAIDRLYDAMNRRDLSALQQLGREHPDFTWESNSDELDSPGRLEHHETLTYARELFEIFDELQTDVLERIDLGEDQMICVVRHRVRGAASGVQVDRREVHLWTARDDLIESLREFNSIAEAREAAREPREAGGAAPETSPRT
jgi:ketosteroid isomerase-like protein